MKKLTLSLLGLLVLVIPLLVWGCETPTTTTTSGGFVTAETYNAGINALQTQINSKADSGVVTGLQTQITALASQSSGANSYAKTETYTKTEVDTLIAKAISDLKVEKPWGTTTSTSTGTSVTGTVDVSFNPASINPIWSSPYTTGSSSFTQFTMHITNNSQVIQYAKIHLTLSTNTQLLIRKINISMNGAGYNMYELADICSGINPVCSPLTYSYQSNLNGISSTTAIFSLQPWGTASSSLSIEPITGFSNNAGEIYLNPGQSQDINVNIGMLLTEASTGQYNITAMIIPHP